MHSVAALNLRRTDSERSAPRPPRRASFAFPDRFKDGEDAEIDVTAPSNKRERYINQSFLSMIANVGSNIPPEPQAGLGDEALQGSGNTRANVSQSVAGLGVPHGTRRENTKSKKQKSEHNRRMVQSTIGLGSQRTPVGKSSRSQLAHVEEDMSSSQILPPRGQAAVVSEETQEEVESPDIQVGEDGQVDTQLDEEETQSSESSGMDEAEQRRQDLASKVAEVFGFAAPEEVVTGECILPLQHECLTYISRNALFAANTSAEMPCWLIQNIVVNGRIYVTPKHVCFYAFLPRKTVGTSS